jgi:hypothetical protein
MNAEARALIEEARRRAERFSKLELAPWTFENHILDIAWISQCLPSLLDGYAAALDQIDRLRSTSDAATAVADAMVGNRNNRPNSYAALIPSEIKDLVEAYSAITTVDAGSRKTS